MAKHVIVKKKRTLKFSGVVGFMMTFALILSFVTQVFVKTNNQQLAREIQTVETQIAEVQTNNENLTADINALREEKKISAIAHEAGLELNDNIVRVKGD